MAFWKKIIGKKTPTSPEGEVEVGKCSHPMDKQVRHFNQWSERIECWCTLCKTKLWEIDPDKVEMAGKDSKKNLKLLEKLRRK